MISAFRLGCTLWDSWTYGSCVCRAVLIFGVLFFRSWFNFKFLARNLDLRAELEPPPPALWTKKLSSEVISKGVRGEIRQLNVNLARRRLSVIKDWMMINFQAGFHAIVTSKLQKRKSFRLPANPISRMPDLNWFQHGKMLLNGTLIRGEG